MVTKPKLALVILTSGLETPTYQEIRPEKYSSLEFLIALSVSSCPIEPDAKVSNWPMNL
ncbi:MAG: hypothetical protein OXE94_13825 [Aestuariivita sp.]|nr:hypothetical protein [Aestuariivita sp.]